MSEHDPSFHPRALQSLSDAAATMGYEIVDIAGFFDGIGQQAARQSEAATHLNRNAGTFEQATQSVFTASESLKAAAEQNSASAEDSVRRVRSTGETAQHLATWVQGVSERTGSVNDTLGAVKKNNQSIANIARQVNTLAINAKIEAARAGDAGRGFAVVADAINSLSQETSVAAVQISENIEELTAWIIELAKEARDVTGKAGEILSGATKNNEVLTQMERSIQESGVKANQIVNEAQRMREALARFAPSLGSISEAVTATTEGITSARSRINSLIDTSETVVQSAAALGAVGDDAKFITHVQSAAYEISNIFDRAVESGEITTADLFDRNYQAVSGSDPQQVVTGFTTFTDSVLPAVQEPALEIDPRVVFCAAVDVNGYLPTHNKKFSQPQTNDPVWNAANSRNRRIFDDRVGLKAGKNTQPFLVQVYRRDMGGGEFAMMKDISAPIFVGGKHWGGLRLAIKF